MILIKFYTHFSLKLWANWLTRLDVCLGALTAGTMKMAVFRVVAQCRLVQVYRRFRGPYCLHHQGPSYQSTRRYNPEDINLQVRRTVSINTSASLIALPDSSCLLAARPWFNAWSCEIHKGPSGNVEDFLRVHWSPLLITTLPLLLTHVSAPCGVQQPWPSSALSHRRSYFISDTANGWSWSESS
jgi:hypothetical protein